MSNYYLFVRTGYMEKKSWTRSWVPPGIWKKLNITTAKCSCFHWLAERGGTITSGEIWCCFSLLHVGFEWLSFPTAVCQYYVIQTHQACQSQSMSSLTWGTWTSHHIDSMTHTLNTIAQLLSRGLKLGSCFTLNWVWEAWMHIGAHMELVHDRKQMLDAYLNSVQTHWLIMSKLWVWLAYDISHQMSTAIPCR